MSGIPEQQTPEQRAEAQKWLREHSPELDALPENWLIKVEPDSKRIYFQNKNGGRTVWDHPTLGPLPEPWILRFCSSTINQFREVKYFNQETSRSTSTDPRFQSKYLKASAAVDPDKKISSSIVKMTKNTSLDNMYREDIGDKDIRDNYDILHAIDKGDGSLGAMNAGVFVVRMKGQDRLCVEKRFGAQCRLDLLRRELDMLHRLKHGSLTFFVAAFITPGPAWRASVYVEFCDRGSLADIIEAYDNQRRTVDSQARVPERFIWHAFGGLCDGLAYLQGGRSYISFSNHEYKPRPGWVPILHRDMKPDNVLLRSRDTLGSRKYYYCVISDFGLACEDKPDQNRNGACGTSTFFAPEQLYDPYVKKPQTADRFPPGGKHSAKTDLYALGISIFCLLMADNQAHFNDEMWKRLRAQGIDSNNLLMGTISRKIPLDVPKYYNYSKELGEAIRMGTEANPQKRPGPIDMVKYLKSYMQKSGFTSGEWQNEDEKIPDWATRKHDFHSREIIDPKEFRER